MTELSAKGPVAPLQPRQATSDKLVRRWGESIGLASAVALVYFLAARLGIGLVMKPAGVAVFWPAAGISSGVLIALGVRRAGWPVAAGVILATAAPPPLAPAPLCARTPLALRHTPPALLP